MASRTAPTNAPSQTKHCKLSYPISGALLVTINRPTGLNSLTIEASYELDSVFQWFDEEPSLRVAVITGAGKAFCVGADLKGAGNDSLPITGIQKYYYTNHFCHS